VQCRAQRASGVAGAVRLSVGRPTCSNRKWPNRHSRYDAYSAQELLVSQTRTQTSFTAVRSWYRLESALA
jgi:hypothetical protein